MQQASKQPPAKPTQQVALEDCLLKLLRGIQDHTVISGEADGQEFRAQLAALESQFKGTDDAHQLVDSAVEILDKLGTRQKAGLATEAERWSALEEEVKA